MKTDIEYELLNIRQTLKEQLDYILSQDVVNIQIYKRIYSRWYACNRMLRHYRTAYRRAV